ncbi:dTDP-4-dehydrorhamnose 3,5-epimerase [Paenibacillus sp. GCM10027627]|uniref:dTDP-4-dehydrorhamnose 3,5-epimerase n=1 Tax=unclassified Paenibacillus TaxID=185978 RepID=UPI003636D89A
MIISKETLNGVKVLEPKVHMDSRGFFLESYSKNSFNELGIDIDFVQDNHSLSVDIGVIRGLHYQLNPKAQAKLVRVISGSIFDVVVDIRRGSPTFGKWEGFHLSADNKRQLFVPSGFAHGFCTTSVNTEVVYKVNEYYSPEYDRGISWNDPALAISWPAEHPVLSDKDKRHPQLSEAEFNFYYEG